MFENLDWWWYFSMKMIFKFLRCPRIVRDICQMSGFSSGSEVTYTDMWKYIYIYIYCKKFSERNAFDWLFLLDGIVQLCIHIEQSLANIVSFAVIVKYEFSEGVYRSKSLETWFIFYYVFPKLTLNEDRQGIYAQERE